MLRILPLPPSHPPTHTQGTPTKVKVHRSTKQGTNKLKKKVLILKTHHKDLPDGIKYSVNAKTAVKKQNKRSRRTRSSQIKTLWQIINCSYNQVVNKSSALVYK